MAITKCEKCNKYFGTKEKYCPQCGRINKNYKKDNTSIYAGLIMFTLGIGIFFGIKYLLFSGIEHENSQYTNILAYNYAEKNVKAQLKSPSSAKFPLWDKGKHSKEISKNKFKINSFVDSKNSFGVIVRTNFSCVITFKDEKVSISNLKIEN